MGRKKPTAVSRNGGIVLHFPPKQPKKEQQDCIREIKDTPVTAQRAIFAKEKTKKTRNMENKENIYQIEFDKINELGDVEYMDEGFAFHTDFYEASIDKDLMRMNMLTIIACHKGKLQVEVNTASYTLRPNEALVCRPNDLIDNYMLSPDFKGAVLCLSRKGIVDQFSIANLWDKAFKIAENPIIRVSSESMEMMKHYGNALKSKLKMKQTPYYREIITSLIKACLYELVANIGTDGTDGLDVRQISQREVLFKQFVDLLASTETKPRSVTWYADRLCVTPKYLSTVCKQVSGNTALYWINEYVKNDIRYWLKSSSRTIKEVADRLDFPNLSFFGKYCRAHFGASPTDLRRKLRQQEKKQ